jgi:hypothetical protein
MTTTETVDLQRAAKERLGFEGAGGTANEGHHDVRAAA